MYDINCTYVEITIDINFLIKYITKGIIQLEDYVKLYSILLENIITSFISFTLSGTPHQGIMPSTIPADVKLYQRYLTNKNMFLAGFSYMHLSCQLEQLYLDSVTGGKISLYNVSLFRTRKS
jgi:hypothetical protein